MNLTKGKISKLYSKQKQTRKRKNIKKKTGKHKSFRSKKKY